MKNLIIFIALAVLIIIFAPEMSFSQNLPPMLPGEPEQAPIDGGLALLAAAGGGYAIKKLRDKKE